MAPSHRIKIKIGDAEFDAEGEANDVKAQFEQFIALLESRSAAKLVAKPSVAATSETSTTAEPQELTDTYLARIFSTRPDGTVSLKVLPKGKSRDSDALLLLLYGYKRLSGKENIFGTQLMKAARISGVQVDRIDRTLAAHATNFMRGGQRRSANYTLNNQGVAAAERMVATIFD